MGWRTAREAISGAEVRTTTGQQEGVGSGQPSGHALRPVAPTSRPSRLSRSLPILIAAALAALLAQRLLVRPAAQVYNANQSNLANLDVDASPFLNAGSTKRRRIEDLSSSQVRCAPWHMCV